jgi:multidrug efflux pump subunit AcrB
MSPGNHIEVIGQIDSMNSAFRDLATGILFAAVFVYLLMVVNYQTWGDPFVVILALPATFCGIVTMLYITGTTLNVPSLMGAIMAIGVASANSILLVTFAREQQLAGMRAFDAAISADRTRIRPVCSRCHICSRCCARAMMASRRTVFSKRSRHEQARAAPDT